MLAVDPSLVRMDVATGRWDRWARDGKSADETAPSANTVRTLALEKDGTLWIGGSGGLDRFDVKTQRFTHHRGREDGLPDPRDCCLMSLAETCGIIRQIVPQSELKLARERIAKFSKMELTCKSESSS